MKYSLVILLAGFFLSGCSTGSKARRDDRERVAQAKGFFCDFVSESDFNDVDVELNLRMAKKCDGSKPFSITGYKRVSDNPGLFYCCNTNAPAPADSSAPSASGGAPVTPAAPSANKVTPSAK